MILQVCGRMNYYVPLRFANLHTPQRILFIMPRKYANPAANRRAFLKTTLIGSAAATLTPLYPALGASREIASLKPAADTKPFELDEITISELQDGMKSGKLTARSLVEKYSARIQEIDKSGPAINSVLELNPDALSIPPPPNQTPKPKPPRTPTPPIPTLPKPTHD